MITLILASTIVFLLWYKFMKPMRHFTDMGVKQTSPWPVFGDEWKTAFGQTSFYEQLQDIYRMYPKNRYVGFYRFTTPFLLITDLDLIKQIGVKDFDYFTDHKLFGPSGNKVASGNLFRLTGQRWRETRATLSGTFTSSKMRNIFHVMKESGESFTRYLLDKNQDIIEVEFKDALTRVTNDVIASAAFGIKVDSLNERENRFYLSGKEITDLTFLSKRLKIMLHFISPFISKLLHITSLTRPEVLKYFRDVIYETIKIREEKGIVRQDMINLLLETRKGIKNEEAEAADTGFATAIESADTSKFRTQKKFSDDDIVAQSLVFFFAGFDAVSTIMGFGLYELALNKDIQDKLRKEIVEAQKASNGALTYEVLISIKYLDMFVSEVLRKWPPAPGTDRVTTKPYTIQPVDKDEQPVHLNVGDSIFLPIVPLHMDPTYFPEPGKFDPERFSDENKSSIVPGTYAPFGFGPRNCIGSRFALLEIKTLLYYLILNFEITPTQKSTIPLKLSTKSRFTAVEGGLWFGLKRVHKGVKNDEAEAIDTGFATAIESADIGKFKKLKKFSDDDIAAQAFVFFFAGFNTVSTAMCFGSYELALNKDVQDKLRKEITEAHKANNGILTYEALMSMKYLDMVVSEILRKWPPAAGIDRVVTKPYTIRPINEDEKPVHLNVGDSIFLPIIPLHRDPSYFPDPDKSDFRTKRKAVSDQAHTVLVQETVLDPDLLY